MIVVWTYGANDQSVGAIGLGSVYTWTATVAAAVFDTTVRFEWRLPPDPREWKLPPNIREWEMPEA